MKPLIIGQSGRLSRRGNTLFFKNEQTSKSIPIESINEIYAFGEIDVNTKVLQLLKTMEISLHFFGYYGNYIGTFYPKEQYTSGKLHIEQIKALEDGRGFEIAKNIVRGISESILYLFRDFEKNGKNVKEFKVKVKENLKKLDKVEGQKQLLQIEGSIWQNFYASFDEVLNKDFVFEKRTKQPPENPVNALISFGKSLVYPKMVSSLYQTQLLQSISYLHSSSERRFSLSLDLSEVFHILLAFKTIFRVVNRKQIQISKHFREDLNGVSLNEAGKQVFVTEFQKSLDVTIEHKTLGVRKIGSLMKYDGYKLQKFLLGEEDGFKPFSILEKR